MLDTVTLHGPFNLGMETPSNVLADVDVVSGQVSSTWRSVQTATYHCGVQASLPEVPMSSKGVMCDPAASVQVRLCVCHVGCPFSYRMVSSVRT